MFRYLFHQPLISLKPSPHPPRPTGTDPDGFPELIPFSFYPNMLLLRPFQVIVQRSNPLFHLASFSQKVRLFCNPLRFVSKPISDLVRCPDTLFITLCQIPGFRIIGLNFLMVDFMAQPGIFHQMPTFIAMLSCLFQFFHLWN